MITTRAPDGANNNRCNSLQAQRERGFQPPEARLGCERALGWKIEFN